MTALLSLLKSKTSGEWLDQKKGIFITNGNNLLIGPYGSLKSYAANLWFDGNERTILRQLHVRFGRREFDTIPSEKLIEGGFRKLIKGRKITRYEIEKLMKEYASQRKTLSDSDLEFEARITDLFKEASSYFSGITLESHHIVEKSMLGDMKKNTGDLNDAVAPCVLIKGELHRRLFTPEGSTIRNGGELFEKKLREFYSDLYRSPEFSDMTIAAKVILDNVFKS